MFDVISCIENQHDYRLVMVAALVCVLGNLAFFILLKRSTLCVAIRRRHWLLVAASAEGITVWATHFISMLAYEGAMPIEFDLSVTLLSVAIAISFFWAAAHVSGARAGVLRGAVAGGLATAGVAAMHLTGMASIIAPARLEFDWPTIAVAALVAGLLFTGGFLSCMRLEGWRGVFLPAIVTVLSIVVLHFSAMSATTLVPDPTRAIADRGALSREWLIPAIVLANLALVGLAVAGAFIDRWLTDAVGLADATLEGIAIVHAGKIIEVNNQLGRLLGVSRGAIIGSAASDWFQCISGDELVIGDGISVEACLRGARADEYVLEIASHVLEYRGRRCSVLAVRDLSERKRAQREIERLASHDPLTDLFNRAYFVRALDEAIDSRAPFALLMLDLDRFKAVNDIFGHAAGDAILQRVAAMLRDCAREHDVIARIGGDEFVIIQRSISDSSDARKLANRILEAFATEMDVHRDPMAVGVSLGVALCPQDGIDPETLQQNADTALYRAKNDGRGHAVFFDQQMDDLARERRALEHDLRHAIARRQLHLVFQPLVATAFGSVIGYEALLRWNHPEHGSISPEDFVPVAEEIGAIVSIGEWVLREACAAAASWPPEISVAVNVSTVQFQLPNLAGMVRDALKQSGLAPHRLELEITETAFIRNRQNTLDALYELRAMGVRIAMDDFGTGYSSLSNLKAFPFDKIKMDKSFVAAVVDDEAARSIVRAIVGLGRSFNMPIVAEGVETEAQRKMLLDEGCPQAQGYLFGTPTSSPFSAEDVAKASG